MFRRVVAALPLRTGLCGQGKAVLPRRAVGLPIGKAGIVGIHDRGGLRRQTGEQLALRPHDGFDRTEFTHVRAPGHRHHANVWRRQRGQAGDFAHMIRAHFDHGEAVFAAEFEQGQRHANVVVQIAFGRQRGASGGTHRGQQLFDRGFPRTAGDGHDLRRAGATPALRDGVQGGERISHDELRQRNFRQESAHHRRHRTAFERGGQMIVAIEAFAAEGEKEVARLKAAGVGAGAHHRLRRR